MSDIEENTKLLNPEFYTAFEPKTQTRFLVKLTDKEGKDVIPTWLIKEIARPKVQWSIVNKSWTWLPITIKTYDPIVPSAAQMFYAYMMEKEPDGPGLFDITINVLGPVGDTVEKWEIKDARFSQIDFGSFDWAKYPADRKSKIDYVNLCRYYSGSDMVEITAVITFDKAELLF